MAQVVLRLLGPLSVAGLEAPVSPPPGRVTTLLALLALEVGRVVSLDRLMDQLWGDEPPQSGPATLHVYVSRLRRLLRGTPARIVTRPPGYLLELPRDTVDAHLLADLVAAAEHAVSEQDWSRTWEVTQRARELRAGTPFLDAYLCSDLTVETDRVERLSRRADELAVRALLALDRPGAAHPLAVELSEADPLNETYWRLRIRAAHALGNDAAALAAYEEFRTLLADELGLDPSERMQRLHLDVLRSGAPAEPLPVERPNLGLRTTPPTAGAPVPIARSAECADLQAAVEASLAGAGRSVVLEGEPGIGKTHLATYAAATARTAGVRVVWARAIDGPGTPPLWMWEQVLGALSDEDGPGGPSGAELLRGLADPDPASTAEPEQARFRLAERIVARVAAASRRQPLLLVFDDVQWADDSTLYSLRLLGQAIGTLSCSVVVTARTGTAGSPVLEATLAAIGREAFASRRQLTPFSFDDVRCYLLDQADASRTLPADEAGALHRRSGGNPFFLGELVRAGGADGRAPTTVAGLVAARLSRLPAPTREALELAAVAGSAFDALVLAEGLGLPLIDLIGVMEPAADEGIVLVEPDSRRWRFVHDLAREAILAEMPPRSRAAWHGKLADAIEHVHADSLDDRREEIADHRFRAVAGAPSPVAYAACRAAADRAAQRLAYDQAALHRSRALATLDLGPTHRRERFAVLLELTTERRLAGDVVGAAASLSQAIELARLIGDRDLLTRAVTVLGGVTLWNWRQFEQVDRPTVALLEELLNDLEVGPTAVASDQELALRQRAELLGTLAVELYYDDARPRGEELAREAVGVARRIGDPALLGRALNNYVIAAWVPGQDPARRAALDESLGWAGRGLPLATEVIARLHRGSLSVRAGDVPAFEADLEQATWLGPRLGILEIEGQVNTQRAGLAVLRGDREIATELIERAHQQLARTSLWGADWTRLVQLATLARIDGRSADIADVLVAKASEDAHRTLRWTAVLAVAEAGDERQARNLQARWGLRTLGRRTHWGSTFEWAQAAETSLLLGSPTPAAAYAALSQVADRLVVAGTAVAIWGPVADVCARLAEQLGDTEARDRHAAAAAEVRLQVQAGLGFPPCWPAATR